jgi:thiamine biosynthesis lipoprotein
LRLHSSRLIFLVVCAALASCRQPPRELALSGPTMGTTYAVKVVDAPGNVEAVAVRRAIDEVLARIDQQMSGYRPDSQVVGFNAASTLDWRPVAPELAEVATIATEVSVRSAGAFDITVAPLVSAWGFGPQGRPADEPDDATLAKLHARTGYRKLHARLEPPALRKDAPDLALDLNGIAPGYAVDRIAARLGEMGLVNFMIEVGGEVRTRGRNARGERWRIAVERPYTDERRPYAILQLDDAAVATSGEYRQFYVRNGQRYSHTMDPRSGRPVSHTLAAVVVIASQAAYADAWATAYNVLGEHDGYALAAKLHMPVMFITARGEALSHRMTPEFERYWASE